MHEPCPSPCRGSSLAQSSCRRLVARARALTSMGSGWRRLLRSRRRRSALEDELLPNDSDCVVLTRAIIWLVQLHDSEWPLERDLLTLELRLVHDEPWHATLLHTPTVGQRESGPRQERQACRRTSWTSCAKSRPSSEPPPRGSIVPCSSMSVQPTSPSGARNTSEDWGAAVSAVVMREQREAE